MPEFEITVIDELTNRQKVYYATEYRWITTDDKSVFLWFRYGDDAWTTAKKNVITVRGY